MNHPWAVCFLLSQLLTLAWMSPAHAKNKNDVCKSNGRFVTIVERRYVPSPHPHIDSRQLYVLSDYVAQPNVGAVGFLELNGKDSILLDPNDLLSTGTSEHFSSFELSEDGALFISYTRNPQTLAEEPSSPSVIVPADRRAHPQSVIFEPHEIAQIEEVAISPHEEKQAIQVIKKETDRLQTDMRICDGKMQMLLFTTHTGQNYPHNKSMQITIDLEVRFN